jgi:branched-chain amino acid transport system substrate-binding protein
MISQKNIKAITTLNIILIAIIIILAIFAAYFAYSYYAVTGRIIPLTITVPTTYTTTFTYTASPVTLPVTQTVVPMNITPTPVIKIKIGLLFPLTGSLAPLGTDQAIGTKLAIDIVNDILGGVMGRYKVEYVLADATSDPTKAASEAERLITVEKVNIIVGTFASPLLLAASEVAERYKVVYYEVGAITDSATLRGFKYLLRNMPIGGDFGIESCVFVHDVVAKALNKKPEELRIAIIHEDGPYGTSVAQGNEATCKKLGLNIVLKEAYSSSATDLSGLILKLKAAKPDVLLHTGYYSDVVLFFRQAQELGFKVPVIIGHGAGYGLPATYQALGKAFDYIFDIDPPSPWLNPEAIKDPLIRQIREEFIKRFNATRGYLPGTHAYMGLHILPLLLDILPRAIQKYGSISSDAIMMAAWETDIPDGYTEHGYGVKFASPDHPEDTVLGKLYRDKPELHIGQNIRAYPVVLQWIGGRVIVVYPDFLALQKPVIPLPPGHPLAP